MQINRTLLSSLLLVLLVAQVTSLSCQDNNRLTISFKNESCVNALNKMASLAGVTIIFNDESFTKEAHVTGSFVDEDLQTILESIIQSTNLKVQQNGSIFIVSPSIVEQFHLQGYVIEKESGERLPFATIIDHLTGHNYSSNEQGYYNIPLTKGKHDLSLSYIGLNTLDTLINISDDLRVNLPLTIKNSLPEVVIDDSSMAYYQNDQNKYSHDYLMRLSSRAPGLGGGSDLLQTAKYLPGVQSGSGGIGGYFVRGGSNDQNLFLLDGVSIYNPFHSLGLSSIFTPQTTKSLQVIKSGFRAQYGDKSSSVIDVKLKDGNNTEYQVEGGINPHDGFLKFEGPIKKGNSSFFIYGRHTTANFKFRDVIRKSLFSNESASNKNNYFDLIGKFNIELDPKNKFFVTFYKGKDILESEEESEEEGESSEFNFSEESKLNWGNQVMNLRWQSFLSKKLFLQASISHNKYFSEYGYLLEEGSSDFNNEEFFYNRISSFNEDIEFKLEVDLSVSQHSRLKTGIGFLRKSFLPDFEVFDEESSEIQGLENIMFRDLEDLSAESTFSTEKFVHFIEGTLEKGSLIAQLGLRSTYFRFDNDAFFHFQPRVNLDYKLNPKSYFFTSAARMIQYIHLLSGSEVNLPRDLWYPAHYDLPPEESWVYNLGFKSNFDHGVSFLAEVYLKNVHNKSTIAQIDYFNTDDVEDLFSISGKAQSYGLEFNLSFQGKKWEGLVSYGLSKSTRTFEELNLGLSYDFQFDRVHELKTVQTIQLSKYFTLGLSGYIATGHPYLVTSDLDPNTGLNPIDINELGQKNSQRTGLNHRIDLSLLYSRKLGVSRHDIKLNLYNAYNQNQPLFYTFNEGALDDALLPNFSIPILPSLSYTVKF